MQGAAKAHPAVKLANRGRFKDSPLESFALGPMMEALNAIEYDGKAVPDAVTAATSHRRPSVHAGLEQFTWHAVRAYLGTSNLRADLRPVRGWWVCSGSRDDVVRESFTWGRRYQSSDGSVRELWLFRFGRAGMRQRPEAELATAAYVTAFGVPSAWPEKWAEPFVPLAPDEVQAERVRVVEFGCLDGSTTVLFDDSASRAAAMFAVHGREAARAVAAGGAPAPGRDCAGCKISTACESLPRIPGLLGIADSSRLRRTLSATDARAFAECPAQEHLARRLHLPRPVDAEYGPTAVRGLAIHAYLESYHSRAGRPACSSGEFPDGAGPWSFGGWEVTGEQAEVGARMLAHHVAACPFRHAEVISQVRVEPVVVAHDPLADVLVVAKPDLLYRDPYGWVWRETKTTQWTGPRPKSLLEQYAQLAFAVLLLDGGVLGPGTERTRIEVEMLRPDGPDVTVIEPWDAQTLEIARRVVTGLAAPWHADTSAPARPGHACQRCPVSQWCPDFSPSQAPEPAAAVFVPEELPDDHDLDDAE